MEAVKDLIQGHAEPEGAKDKKNVDAMRYPSSIIEWELKHHIVRIERNGMVYITCTDFDAFNKQLDEERLEAKRRNLRQKIAEAQDAAYLGEQQTMDLSGKGGVVA